MTVLIIIGGVCAIGAVVVMCAFVQGKRSDRRTYTDVVIKYDEMDAAYREDR